ncbi:MAG TPA: maltose alpha-D-glucosyltransferase [Vicinamibacterales bacterium]|jgi:maltose alpha-D-glucosyltransferase/alpha-amylase|nr:maltose alpha-D-glucosyltransferase [Vicinamibacterales bacterium]
MSARDALWYKDAIIYELHVKTYADANGDGVGDFDGLIGKLGYLQRLGVTCLWLLPFYESPRRDDGYDVAHYERVHADYGTLESFARFVEAAHDHQLQVITELVINHTSGQHPWFKAARLAPPGSSKRNFYVWSDTDQRYRDARVIFRDAESSNWEWDPLAGAFYWHRFFRHQPDLNYDNPRVRRAVLKVMRFWLDRGVDGLRLDAVSHLYEREGTRCENLPETHAFLKEMRADMDRRYAGRVLLAEANQWPPDEQPYFGNDDECQMAFHFPLMPRVFLALEREEALPIVDIITRTPAPPPGCQWALFLRNHDELTLSAVTDEERDVLVEAYAPDPRMRLNSGIRRRLAPLLNNDRRRIELAHALLFSLPGTPVLYYGDEIGMGDNLQLSDRDGLRTPMQWSDDLNGGFSGARGRRLVLPPIDDAVYGYQAVNVARQARDPDSLLASISRLIAVRRRHPAFGRGSIEFLPCNNPHVLTFVRRLEGDTIVVVANLAASIQFVAIDLPAASAGAAVVELIDDTPVPPVGSSPYGVTLGPHACYWLALSA